MLINVESLPKPTELAVPAFVLLVLVEMVYMRRRPGAGYEGRDTLTSLIMGLGSTLAGALTGGAFLLLAYWIWGNFRLFDFQPTLSVFLVAFILDDLGYYWRHRLGHRMRWMWAAHVVHHSSQRYNLSTALRQTWTGAFTPGFIINIPLYILGIEPAILVFCSGLNLIYQFWIHTEAIDRMPPWFEAVFNTPSHHRVHHAKNPRYLDANYAGVLIIWDKMFGSFVPEDTSEPCRYGLVSDLGSYNPLRVAFHEWAGMARDIAGARHWRDRFLYLMAPPGWSPDGSRLTSDAIKARWQAQNKGQNRAATPSDLAAAE